MWFTKLIKQFFFWIDKIVYNFIPAIYDLLLDIARTSILTQADIANMADRIYKLLAIFMIFKVTLSLITYVVNPDDFSDKTKGVAKLGTNIIISLSLLILTPYIFNYAYQLQTIVLEDNSLATLVFGDDLGEKNFLNSAGDEMAYISMNAFFTPNLSLGKLHECTTLFTPGVDGDGKNTFNEACKKALEELTIKNDNFTSLTLTNYVAGVENSNLGMMFRQDLALSTAKNAEGEEDFVMDYKFIFSTVVGVIIILLLITFCMDVAVRSLKLAFFQLIAPIPILSYVDPKSGKDGLFKKWYEMCFKTFLSLFIRLLALYFSVYIISKVGDMQLVDIIDGSYKSGFLLSVFVIIGALMFAKQLPEILKGLGIKLDGDGKFTLNPIKKFEEGALGGKRLTGAVGGMVAGIPRGKIISGAMRGFVGNKGLRGGFEKQADVNRKIGEARINGAGFWGSRFAGLTHAFGMENADMENENKKINKEKHRIDVAKRNLDAKVQEKENRVKRLEDGMKPDDYKAEKMSNVSKKGKALVDFSKDEIKNGKAGLVSTRSKHLENLHSYLEEHQNTKATQDISYYAKGGPNGRLQIKTIKAGETITPTAATEASEAIGYYSGKQGAIEHLDVRLKGKEGFKPMTTKDSMGLDTFIYDSNGSIQYEPMSKEEKDEYDSGHADFKSIYIDYEETAIANGESTTKEVDGQQIDYSAKDIKAQSDNLDAAAKEIDAYHAKEKAEIAKLKKEISEDREKETIIYEGEEITIAEAERRISVREKELNDRLKTRKTDVEAYINRRIGPSGGK